MRTSWLIVCSLLVGATSGATVEPPSCEPVEGIEPLLAPGRVLVLGELHGTEQSPAFTADIACHAAAAGLEVVVGLELPSSHPDDPIWRRSYQDGRTSRAMLDLLQELAELRRAGHRVRVAPFDASSSGGGQARDRAMAANLATSVEASPDAMHVVLTGDVHSRIARGGLPGPDFEPMAYLLARRVDRERVIALNAAHAGGTAWICAPDCGTARVRGRGPDLTWKIELDEATRPAGHDGWYGVGAITASPPTSLDHSPVAPALEPDEGFPEQTAELLRPDSEPAAIDFMIEDCRCDYRGRTSRAIFRLAGESIVLAAPTPGSPRPKVFNPNDGRMVEHGTAGQSAIWGE